MLVEEVVKAVVEDAAKDFGDHVHQIYSTPFVRVDEVAFFRD